MRADREFKSTFCAGTDADSGLDEIAGEVRSGVMTRARARRCR